MRSTTGTWGLALALSLAPQGAAGDDAVGRELEALKQRAAATHADEFWTQVQPGAKGLLDRAGQAWAGGHRRAALYRLSAARELLGAWDYASSHREARDQQAAFDAEWKRAGAEIASAPRATSVRGSAFHRALAEAALGEVRVYHEASLEYAHATQPLFGLFYIGQAFAARDTDGFMAGLSAEPEGALPAVRSLEPELDALESELLAAYRPPRSIDEHPRFIAASGALKQARELDAAGLRFGALLRYLEAALRSAALRSTPTPIDEAAARAKAAEWVPRLAAGDHSLARLFVEVALSEAAHPGDDGRGRLTAGVVFADLLPRYFAALVPAAPRPVRRPAAATVTLVRWPYT
jgi:hypothetical protein